MKQLNNVKIAAPKTKMEVVCHGPGIYMLVVEKSLVHDQIQIFKTKGVAFTACENTLRERNISKDKIIPEAGFVPSALIHIVTRQEEGWSYIKAGF
jgi:intracellular sulfur oxidation DsrE/DsrF family protein